VSMLRIAKELEVPLELATEATAILGKRGRGKTNTAVVIVEEMIGAGIPVCVVDTVGVWWGLKSSADGQKAGLPVVVFGGEHADVQLEETAGKVIARVLVDKRIAMVIDTSAFSKAGTRRFLHDFVTEVYHRNRQALHLVFDEADEVAPQRILDRDGGYATRLLGAMEDLVRRGRARGIGVTLVTQRPAVLNKDVLTQVEVLIAMGMTGVTDVKAIDEWIKLHDLDDQASELRASLPGLPVGTGWVWSPSWLEILQRVSFRERHTFDSSATPKIGQVRVEPKVLASVDLTKLGEEIAATVEKQKAEDPKELRRRIAELESRPAVTAEREVIRTVEVRTFTAEDLTALAQVGSQLEKFSAALAAAMDSIQAVVAKVPRPQAESRTAVAPRTTVPLSVAVPQPVAVRTSRSDTPSDSLGKAQRAVLSVLAMYGERTHVQVAILSGYSPKSGGFANTLSTLRSAGFVEGGRAGMNITDAGREALGEYEPLPSGQALLDHWFGQVGQQHRAILAALLEAYPNSLTHGEIADRTGYSPTSGGFANSLSKLRTLELIHGGRDAITVSDTLGGAL